jgi:hypothetical protein
VRILVMEHASMSLSGVLHAKEKPFCAHCLAPQPTHKKFKTCSQCKVPFFCGRACHVAHWQAIHRNECKQGNVEIQSALQIAIQVCVFGF